MLLIPISLIPVVISCIHEFRGLSFPLLPGGHHSNFLEVIEWMYYKNYFLLLFLFQVFIDETADPWYRGNILCFQIILLNGGTLLMSSFGALVHWRSVCIACTLFTALAGFLLLFTPESPSWLVRNKRNEEAEKSLIRIWGPGSKRKVCTN